MPYTAQFFAEKLNVPVEYFNPLRNVQLDPSINKGACAVRLLFACVEIICLRSDLPGIFRKHPCRATEPCIAGKQIHRAMRWGTLYRAWTTRSWLPAK